MIQLQRLSLCRNNLSSISFISGLLSLEHLNLQFNENLDIVPLSYLVNLTTLDISYCAIKNIQSLRTLVKLKELNAIDTKIKDISILKQFKCLKELNISCNLGINITELQYLTQLTKLILNECDIHDISALRPLVNLEYLELSNNSIFYFYPIRDLDENVEFEDNLIVESSDFFTFFDVKNKSQFINRHTQPNKQEIQLAENMKKVDTTIFYIRDINTKYKYYLSRKKMVVTTITSLKQKQHDILLSLTNKVVQLYIKMDEKQYQ
ncbi:leucine-rich_repeat domain-containing protein [Hexamita inflata]|uniref:Leucine-rich repeat domain-containing protein n=1 Tax=Hexamita inflata TaxID=28002 RepID=A0AA86PZC5_9EUKA|nr:leucine-rich repeat domain-containing protein [Hexamita inflata]